MKRRHLFSLALAALLSAVVSTAGAQPVIDGTASLADGYASLSVQNTNTEFGDSTTGDLIDTAGSEINQVFAKIENDRLYMVIAGNLQDNFDKLNIFVDSVSGGVNQIDGDVFTPGDNNVPFGMDPFSCSCGGFPPPDGTNTDNEGALQAMDGMRFDTDDPNNVTDMNSFRADYALAFTHGGEDVGPDNLGFWAMSAHYADLTQGTAGDVVAAGIVLAPNGLPRVLRGPLGGDFNTDGNVDGQDFLIWQRNAGTFDPNTGGAMRSQGDANDDGVVNGADLDIWEIDYGNQPTLGGSPFVPNSGILSTSILIGPELPGLSQGELIDQNYASDPNRGGCTDDAGTGCIIRELEFVLPVDAAGNPNDHRNFENTIDLQMAINNSNTAGVQQGALFDPNAPGNDPNASVWTATGGDPNEVITGIEFSIPLSEIGDPNSGDDIKIVAFINGSGFDFSSNQYAGEGVLQNNLGGDGTGGFTGDLAGVDLSAIAGDQFVTISVPIVPSVSAVPEPSTLTLVLLGTGLVLRRRKQ